MIPKIGIGIILMGIIIIIAAFAVPSLAIVQVGNANSSPSISYYGGVPSSQSVTSPSTYASSTSNILSGEFTIYNPNIVGTQYSTVTWYISSVIIGPFQPFNVSFDQHYYIKFINGNATLNVSTPYIYQTNTEFSVYLTLNVNGSMKYTTNHYYGIFASNGTVGSIFNLLVMYKNMDGKYVISNTSNLSGFLKIPYQTAIKAEYLRPSLGPLPSNITTWLEINGKYHSISYDIFHNYTLKPGNNTLVFGYNVSAVPGVHGNVSITLITEYIYVEPYNVNITILVIGIVVTLIGVVVLVRRKI
jgi:hypothetical protein